MATVIQIKRSTTTATPPSLANGEVSYTSNGDILYIGSNGAIIPIGGKRTPGTLTANQALVANATSYMDVLRTANLFVGTISINVINNTSNSTVLGAASNSELTSTWAIKNYVDTSRSTVFTTVTTTNTDLQTIDSFTFSAARSVEYFISVKNTTDTTYQTTKIILMHNDSAAFLTEYGQIYSNTSLGSYFGGANATHALLQCVPIGANNILHIQIVSKVN